MTILNVQSGIVKGGAKLTSMAALALACGNAQAASITWYMTNMFSGTTAPAGYTTIVLDDMGSPGSVLLTMTNNWSASSGQYADEISFNVNTAFAAAGSALTIAYLSGQNADSIDQSATHAKSDSFKADGDGYFDVVFKYAQSGSGRFTGGETSVFTLTKAGLVATDLDFGSQYSTASYKAATHIQGVADGSSGGTSSWMSPGPLVIPLPSGAALAAMGLFVVPVIRRRPIAG